MTESKFTRDWFDKTLRADGAYIIAVVGSERQQVGLPDRIIMMRPGLVVAVELKGPKTKLKAHQTIVLKDIRARGVATAVGRIQPDWQSIVFTDIEESVVLAEALNKAGLPTAIRAIANQ